MEAGQEPEWALGVGLNLRTMGGQHPCQETQVCVWSGAGWPQKICQCGTGATQRNPVRHAHSPQSPWGKSTRRNATSVDIETRGKDERKLVSPRPQPHLLLVGSSSLMNGRGCQHMRPLLTKDEKLEMQPKHNTVPDAPQHTIGSHPDRAALS